jgi:hypothetical protein
MAKDGCGAVKTAVGECGCCENERGDDKAATGLNGRKRSAERSMQSQTGRVTTGVLPWCLWACVLAVERVLITRDPPAAAAKVTPLSECHPHIHSP